MQNAILKPIKEFPQRLYDFIRSPLRIRNFFGRVLESLVGIGVFYLLGPSWAAVGWGVLAEFVLYEFVLEPLGFVGPYFERGPRDGEKFNHE
jgi:hypothetical protein